MPKPIFFTNTPIKDSIRKSIIEQFTNWLKDKQTAVFNTLESDQWIVAREVAQIAENQSKRITLHNFEMHWAKVKAFCPWLDSAPASINYVQHSFGKDKFFRYIHEENVPTFSWADYCGTPLKKEIKSFRKSIREGDVVYVTFSLNPRFKPSIERSCLAILKRKKNESWETIGEKITERLEKIIRQKLGNNFKRILYSHYITNEGKRGQTPMITVGWHFKKNGNL